MCFVVGKPPSEWITFFLFLKYIMKISALSVMCPACQSLEKRNVSFFIFGFFYLTETSTNIQVIVPF